MDDDRGERRSADSGLHISPCSSIRDAETKKHMESQLSY